jgi:hypothetical protein
MEKILEGKVNNDPAKGWHRTCVWRHNNLGGDVYYFSPSSFTKEQGNDGGDEGSPPRYLPAVFLRSNRKVTELLASREKTGHPLNVNASEFRFMTTRQECSTGQFKPPPWCDQESRSFSSFDKDTTRMNETNAGSDYASVGLMNENEPVNQAEPSQVTQPQGSSEDDDFPESSGLKTPCHSLSEWEGKEIRVGPTFQVQQPYMER